MGDWCVVGSGARLRNCTLVGGNVVAPRVELDGEVLDVNEHVFFVRDEKGGAAVRRVIVAGSADGNKVAQSALHAALLKAMPASKLRKL